ncbi:MAG: CorA family divalent cation transporter [Ignavibacteria bacterium]|nr:CorA family divalent cation transporter [Ignavibacteria bacterium]
MSKVVKTYSNFEWIDLENPDKEELHTVIEPFNIDINLIIDTLQYGHLPKIENVNNYTFIILRAYSANLTDNVTTIGELSNKIAFFINEERLITIHRASFDFLKNLTGEFNSSESVMLSIINSMLLTFEEPLQFQSDKMDKFEGEIFLKSGGSISIESLYYQKSKARISKKILHLTQNVLNLITVKPELNSTLQDLRETTIRFLLHYDEVLEDATTILNSYISVTAQRSNEVMKLLTIFSAFFLPLTFIAGIYGMNFEFMPELEWKSGYFIILGVMVSVALTIFIWFKRKKIM